LRPLPLEAQNHKPDTIEKPTGDFAKSIRVSSLIFSDDSSSGSEKESEKPSRLALLRPMTISITNKAKSSPKEFDAILNSDHMYINHLANLPE
jgi:hypothetical protein